MASEDCLEVCFVGLVVEENYVWYLVIVVGDVLKSSILVEIQATKGGLI